MTDRGKGEIKVKREARIKECPECKERTPRFVSNGKWRCALCVLGER